MKITITTTGTMPKISSKPPMPCLLEDYHRGADVVMSKNTLRPLPLTGKGRTVAASRPAGLEVPVGDRRSKTPRRI
jgi:hypothetical protein